LLGVFIVSLQSDAADLDLGDLWSCLLWGTSRLVETYCRNDRCYGVLEECSGHRAPPCSEHASVLERYLIGESQKEIAFELGMSISSVASHCATSLRAMSGDLVASRCSIVLVMAALTARGRELPRARLERILDERYKLLSVEVPGNSFASRLTPSELAVARLAIEGKTHAETAVVRKTSMSTIANQLASAFRKLGVSGRNDLRARAVFECAEDLTDARVAAAVVPQSGRRARAFDDPAGALQIGT
jgi:DNA-binding CsgD family transcriptional regulator